MKEYQSPKMADAKEMADAKRAIEWVISDIERASIKGEAKTAGFILISCAIDFLATLHKGTKSNGKVYSQFIDAFFEDKDVYKGRELYDCLRCGLVHNYTIHDSKYILTHGHPDRHGELDGGKIILNLENFFDDLVKAKQRYLARLKASKDLQENVKRQVSKVGVLGLVPFSPEVADEVADNVRESSGSSTVSVS